MSLSEKRERLSRLVRLTLDFIDHIPINSVCHESRDVVLNAGYRTWTLYNKKGARRDVLWNPLFDTIALVGPHTHGAPQFYTQILELQFASQAKDIQKLAMPTTNWRPPQQGDEEPLDIATRWLLLESLREIVIVIDEAWEKRFVKRLRPALGGRHRFEIPRDIEMSLQKCKENAPADWDIPTLRVVSQESEILGQKNIHMSLRCLPCLDLGIYS